MEGKKHGRPSEVKIERDSGIIIPQRGKIKLRGMGKSLVKKTNPSVTSGFRKHGRSCMLKNE